LIAQKTSFIAFFPFDFTIDVLKRDFKIHTYTFYFVFLFEFFITNKLLLNGYRSKFLLKRNHWNLVELSILNHWQLLLFIEGRFFFRFKNLFLIAQQISFIVFFLLFYYGRFKTQF